METTAMVAGAAETHSLVRSALELKTRVLTHLQKQQWLALLLGRLAIGVLFASTGWGKVHDLAHVTEFFRSLGIPFPELNAVVVGYSELLCGSALALGLLTRLATLPLLVSMVVAIVTARLGDVGGIVDLIALEEFTYLVLLAMLLILGPGRASLDHVLAKRIDARLSM